VNRHVFHTVMIGGMVFEGVLSGDGPYISCNDEGVALGLCTSSQQRESDRLTVDNDQSVLPHSGWITKYRTQPRIPLQGLTAGERLQLAQEFGMRRGHLRQDRREKLRKVRKGLRWR